MIPLAGIAVLAASTAIPQQSSPRVILNGEAIEVMLPANAFKNAEFVKYLGSGLTTTIVVSIEDDNDRKHGARGAMRIAVRYDLWDENYRVTRLGPDEKPEQLTQPSNARLNEWLTATRFHIADVPAGHVPQTVRVAIDVIPFSASEQDEAQRWLLHSMRDAERTEAAGGARDRSGTGAAFDRMIAGSVQPKAVLSWHWKVPLSPP